jgi:hypothetical protein
MVLVASVTVFLKTVVGRQRRDRRQRAAIEAFAKAGYELVDEFYDVAVSGECMGAARYATAASNNQATSSKADGVVSGSSTWISASPRGHEPGRAPGAPVQPDVNAPTDFALEV